MNAVQCQRCGLWRPESDMARSTKNGEWVYWCHPGWETEPTCYMRSSWDGLVYLRASSAPSSIDTPDNGTGRT